MLGDIKIYMLHVDNLQSENHDFCWNLSINNKICAEKHDRFYNIQSTFALYFPIDSVLLTSLSSVCGPGTLPHTGTGLRAMECSLTVGYTNRSEEMPALNFMHMPPRQPQSQFLGRTEHLPETHSH